MRADLDTLVIALYCAACALFPSERTPRRGRPEKISDNELLALMVAQMLLQCPSDRASCAAPVAGLVTSSRTCRRSRATTSAAARWRRSSSCSGKRSPLRRSAPATTCGCSTRHRCPAASRSRRHGVSQLAPWAGFGYCAAHSRRYCGFKLVLLCAADGTIVDFDLVAANTGERNAALALLEANPIEGTTIISDKGFADADFEAAVRELRALLLRPSRSRRARPSAPPSTSTNTSDSAAARLRGILD